MANVQRHKVDANYAPFVNGEEEQRLAVLDERIERKKAILADAYQERKRIVARVIKRMRRAAGKS